MIKKNILCVLLSVVFAAVMMIMPVPAGATDYYWIGGEGDGWWDHSGNWNPAGPPPNGMDHHVVLYSNDAYNRRVKMQEGSSVDIYGLYMSANGTGTMTLAMKSSTINFKSNYFSKKLI